jgi:uncharacterized protein
MILDLREYKEFPAKASVEAVADEFDQFAEDVSQVNSVKAELAIQRSEEEFFCQGKVFASFQIECSRCLQPYEKLIKQKTDFVICSEAYHEKIREDRIDDEDYVYFSGSDLRVDIADLVRQVLVLSVPMMPVCSDECQGLCPQCGTNLNKSKCECDKEKIDPRWEGLKKLRDPDQKQ